MENFKIIITGSTRWLSLLLLFTLAGCGNQSGSQSNPEAATSATNSESSAVDQGYVLLKGYCYSCHAPNSASHDQIVAPPMAAVKTRYLMTYPDKATFVAKMSAFMLAPKPEEALMKDAVQRFNLMPAMSIGEEHLEKIITYIYDNEMEEPAWFEQHQKEMHKQKGLSQPDN